MKMYTNLNKIIPSFFSTLIVLSLLTSLTPLNGYAGYCDGRGVITSGRNGIGVELYRFRGDSSYCTNNNNQFNSSSFGGVNYGSWWGWSYQYYTGSSGYSASNANSSSVGRYFNSFVGNGCARVNQNGWVSGSTINFGYSLSTSC